MTANQHVCVAVESCTAINQAACSSRSNTCDCSFACCVVFCSFQRLVFTSAAKMFSSTYRVRVEGEGDTVGYQNPLLAVAAAINVSRPGLQPSLSSIPEDMRLLDARLTDKFGVCHTRSWPVFALFLCRGVDNMLLAQEGMEARVAGRIASCQHCHHLSFACVYVCWDSDGALITVTAHMQCLLSTHSDTTCVNNAAGRPVSGAQRQRFFDRPSNMEGVVFDTENVYTFVLCQSIMDMPNYRSGINVL